ncbi:HPr kinase/phosphorylase [Corallococcus exiguus]|uniref:HPr kinase/phosphorylase n=1 Tax=Corallococcus exiguus TaxID=83462 RepID=A0A7Y1S8Q2_9BACT|nr:MULTISPECIES: HPr(Ser) kinase/phosphatase [Corallococcus]RKI32621.1 HPr kinase/phosphorylase [Corallococcus sp. AB004]NBC42274.1 HPr kinase/phosphorylase [Corallococcus exiguus]NNB90858.1 HPr kinase/phosphorylase [Corallococcus exiguus]NNB98648.1 HPr kinase/phosphorylase [Corallococcus exiguus]NNC09427.1 HPr kinase/phosphorylase [Corallococcus exiguus]
MKSIRISQLLEDQGHDLRLTLMAGTQGLARTVDSSRIQKPGLALAGFTEHLHPHRVQVFGNTEISYLATLAEDAQHASLAKLFSEEDLACVVVTKALDVPRALVDACEAAGLSLMKTPLLSSEFIQRVQNFLEDALTESSSLHGVLMDVFGVGILLLGKSGIGKSEIALDLVMRGHRLVADDIVDVTRRKGAVYGAGNPVIKHHMEIRGLGIINIKDLFGVSAVREQKKIELVIELQEWDPHQEYDRLGVEDKHLQIVGVDIPLSVVPVRPGRNMATIVEVAARNQLLKLQGHHSAREFAERLNRAIAQGAMRRTLGEEVE